MFSDVYLHLFINLELFLRKRNDFSETLCIHRQAFTIIILRYVKNIEEHRGSWNNTKRNQVAYIIVKNFHFLYKKTTFVYK